MIRKNNKLFSNTYTLILSMIIILLTLTVCLCSYLINKITDRVEEHNRYLIEITEIMGKLAENDVYFYGENSYNKFFIKYLDIKTRMIDNINNK